MQPKPFQIPALFKPGQLTLPQVGGGSPYGAQAGLAAAGPAAAPGNPRSALVAALSGGKPDVASLIPLLQQMNAAKAPATGTRKAGAAQTPLTGNVTPRSPQPQIEIEGNVTAQDRKAVALAQHFIGTPYSWGGGGPSGPSRGTAQGAGTVGFDCSSLLQFVWHRQGVNIPRTTYDQFKAGHAVAKNALRAGDAVFFRGSDARGGLPGHVGIYIGHGKFIEAPRTGATVRISLLAGRSDYVGGRRYG